MKRGPLIRRGPQRPGHASSLGISIARVVVLATLGLAAASRVAAQPTPVPSVTLLHGDGDPRREDIVILGDGYNADQQDDFDVLATALVQNLMSSQVFAGFHDVVNVYRVNVSSIDAGTDDFVANCVSSVVDGEGRLIPVPRDMNTAMNTGFCGGGLPNSVHRLLLARDELQVHDLAALAGDYDMVLVIVNSTGFGGGVPQPVTGTNNSRFAFATVGSGGSQTLANVMLHEIGHALAGLADEYSDDSLPPIGPLEPSPPNVTIQTNRASLKWRSLVDASTAIPTSQKTGGCETAPLLTLRRVVGTFAGAYYRSCGVYRPQAKCRMRDRKSPMCAVCLRELHSVLEARRLELKSAPSPTIEPTVPPDALTPIVDLTSVETPTAGGATHQIPTTIRIVLGRLPNQIRVYRARASYGIPRLLTERDYARQMDSFLRGETELFRYRALDANTRELYSGLFAIPKAAFVEAQGRGEDLVHRRLAPLPIPIVHVDLPYSRALFAMDFEWLAPTGTPDLSNWRTIGLGREQVTLQ